ncbi:hypothetical protein T11_5198 [Trichinella zimbabwensis]|uniref:Uncharacterized protein n=1 Tax=Trichinella zimbabwensis TaxID=268475 RepID=A0A0V1H0P1_9BILA|nr:hypothetical protein T11_5198 [Trichinella zimbabwensis]
MNSFTRVRNNLQENWPSIWDTLLIPLPVTFTQCVRCKSMCVGAKPALPHCLTRHQASRGHKERFLYFVVTGDEKWCFYVKLKQRRNNG